MAKYELDTLRHSAAHVMAHAIKELFPNENVQLGIGPVIENGFYYDIEMQSKITDEDLLKIEEKMKEIIARKLPITRHEISKADAIKFFKKDKQDLKIELIESLPEGEVITYYSHADQFSDLCRGPHVENTGHIPPFFKLLNTAGAYWRGDESRKMLQRVYAASFDTKKRLEDYLLFIEEAKKRDHRKLGKELGLFHFEPAAPATPFFLPKGTIIYNKLIEYVRFILKKFNYQEVLAPQVLDVNLWHTSGHYENYKENMYFTRVEEKDYALKPMNCPGHMLLFRSQKHSYRELPLRIAEFGKVHRFEKSGVVSGLTRVRGFTQDDAHIFLAPEQIEEEILSLLKIFFVTYKHFDFKNFKVNLSTRPEKKIGDDKIWDAAENALKSALERFGHPYTLKEGDGAFYGPKIDFDVADAINRYHQLGTIQLDFMMPERFELKFTASDGTEKRPVVIHRALLGSLERFFGVYLEHVGGVYPFWLAPEQVAIVPVKNDLHLEFCEKLFNKLTQLGFRVSLDSRNESMGLKTRQIQQSKVPFMLVIGDKEISTNSVSIRKYGEQKSETKIIDELIKELNLLNAQQIPQEFL